MDLAARIEELYAAGDVDAGPVEEAMRLLDAGEVRVAEPSADGWVVNEWTKKAILLYFKLRKVEPMDSGTIHYLDKIPLKSDFAERGVRVVPGGIARYGAFLSPGVVLMP
ncbi:MAG: 2,3,4,5-tetrahydropyridine-2,6-dicarboxylate N-succinyltransferase, partial [Gaiellaceae bacterium]